MMDFMASVIMRSVLFWALSKLSRLSLAVAAYANKLYSNLGLYVSLFNCSLVAWLEYLLHVLASWRIIISFWLAFPSAGQYVVSLLSNKIGIMIASLHFCRSVRTEWSAVVIYFHVADLSKCVNISFVAPSGTWDFLYFGWRLLGPRLVSGILSCVPMPRVLLSLFRSFSFWCFIMTGMLLTSSYLSDIRLAAYLYVTILLQGLCNSLIVLVIQMFDKSPKLLIIPFKIQCGCFGFSPFHWSYRMPKEFDPYLQQNNGCS